MDKETMWEELLKDIAIIKWAVICIAVSLWGLTAYLFLKEFAKMWGKQDPKNNLHNLPKEECEEGHY
tara:strand:- start:19 stop:219 length:201 start_codon:yes stop_codon:yes gene_type:complete